jgi:cold shock CspA family protein
MIVPVQLAFRNLEPSEDLEELIQAEAASLDTFYPRITNCRVVVEKPHKHHLRGQSWRVRVDIGVPGKVIVVNHEPSLRSTLRRMEVDQLSKENEVQVPHKDINIVIRDTFAAARRRLQDYARRQRGDVKEHESLSQARVIRLFPADDYGFLQAPDGAEIYFHRNSVLQDGFDQLEIGAEVSYVEEHGDKGLQASTVRLLGH